MLVAAGDVPGLDQSPCVVGARSGNGVAAPGLYLTERVLYTVMPKIH